MGGVGRQGGREVSGVRTGGGGREVSSVRTGGRVPRTDLQGRGVGLQEESSARFKETPQLLLVVW